MPWPHIKTSMKKNAAPILHTSRMNTAKKSQLIKPKGLEIKKKEQALKSGDEAHFKVLSQILR